MNNNLSQKADKSDSIEGYGINNAVRFNFSNNVKDIVIQLYIDSVKNKVLQLIIIFNDDTRKIINLSTWT